MGLLLGASTPLLDIHIERILQQSKYGLEKSTTQKNATVMMGDKIVTSFPCSSASNCFLSRPVACSRGLGSSAKENTRIK